MKEACLMLLLFLLLKNLGFITWEESSVGVDFEGTRNRAVNLLQGDE